MKTSSSSGPRRLESRPEVLEAIRLRARVVGALRRYLDARGFTEVTTPCLTPTPDPAPHLDSFHTEFRGAGLSPLSLYLLTSPEHALKRLVAAGLDRVYQIGPFFRNGELGPQHNPEFTGLEWYQAGASVEQLMDQTEELVRTVAIEACGRTICQRAGQELDLARPFERLTVRTALERLAGVRVPTDWNPRELRLALQQAGLRPGPEDGFDDLVQRALVGRVDPALELRGPVFLTDYPAPMAALARLRPERPCESERFELFAGGLELCNGYGELTDAAEQRQRFMQQNAERERLGLSTYQLDEAFLGALERGLPACAGNALGVDRLVMLLAGVQTIEEVQAFPLADELSVEATGLS